MPFEEPGAQELLERVDARRCRIASPTRPSARHIVITLGTPALSHIEIDLRDIRSVLDDLLGHPAGRPLADAALDRRARARPSSSPATWRSTAASSAGSDISVAHAPERIAAGRFLEEIGTLPCIIGGVGEGSGEVVGELFSVFGAPIVQTTPVQAELAKIWTNILRYATFALPNLLMMDCEQYGANVFEVIDLINRDYPRGGIAAAGPDRRDVPAQGLRVQRGALARAGHAARGQPRARERAAVPRPGRMAPADRLAGRQEDRRPRPGVQGRHRRRARLAVAQARAPARARAGRRRRPRPARRDADRELRRRGARRRRGRRRHQPRRVLRPRRAARAIADGARRAAR